MSSAAQVRAQVQNALAARIPAALGIAPRDTAAKERTGILAVDEVLGGGLPVGAITEIVGAECSGRTSFTLSFLAAQTQAGKVCAWVDVSDALQPEAAAAAGMELSRLLWVRCGAASREVAGAAVSCFELPKKYLAPPMPMKGLHGGGCGGHPRDEVKGLSEAVKNLLRPESMRQPLHPEPGKPFIAPAASVPHGHARMDSAKPWARIEQGLRVVDLLLQGGGFSAIVLDLAGIAPELSSRVPLATWFRYRAAAERSRTSVLLLTQHACAKSSAGLVLQLRPGDLQAESTVFAGMTHHVEVVRQRFNEPSKVVPLRKPPQRVHAADWQSKTAWAGRS